MPTRLEVFRISLALGLLSACSTDVAGSGQREQGVEPVAQPANDAGAGAPWTAADAGALGPDRDGVGVDAGRIDGPGSELPRPVRVMPLGDSLTFGTSAGPANLEGGYRIHLLELLNAAGYGVEYVGPEHNGPSGFDGDHNAKEGASIPAIQRLWVDADPALDPHVVLLMAGTNDALGVTADQPPEPASRALGVLIDRISTDRPDAQIVVSKLIPLVPRLFGLVGQENAARIPTYNRLVEQVVEQKRAAGLNVHLADLSSINGDELGDGIHPSMMATYDEMAELWFPSVVDAIEALRH